MVGSRATQTLICVNRRTVEGRVSAEVGQDEDENDEEEIVALSHINFPLVPVLPVRPKKFCCCPAATGCSTKSPHHCIFINTSSERATSS